MTTLYSTTSQPHPALNYSTVDFKDTPIDRALEHRVALYRLGRLRQQVKEHDLNAVVLFDPINIRYACGVRNMQVYSQRNPARYLVVPAEGPVVLFEYRACGHLAKDMPTIDEIRGASPIMPLHSGPHSPRHVSHFVADIEDVMSRSTSGGKRIGIESAPTEVVSAMIEHGYTLVDASRPVEIAKSIKSFDELTLIAKSVELTEQAMTVMERAIEPGLTENALWSIFQQKVIETGGEYMETRLLNSGDRTNPWFQETSDKKLAAGELIAFDTDTVGVYGYYTDFSRTFFVGSEGARPSAKQKELYSLSRDEIETNIALMRPGMSFREYSEKAWKIPEGYQEHRYLAVVHGCGMTGEWPIISHSMDWDEVGYDGVIQPGMTLCVESFCGHRDGGEGVKLEEQVLVTETGIRRMSTYGYSDILTLD
ncbi:Xaa-Pro peptidase family protein [Salinicola sp. RZ23]|uniref:M24 family metallopeptidase n=1 Tax=Salinicola sp. RZ23 TaxID=1949087 RepID=UPI000DA1EF0F|nr:Xaa-Pro peptidase family protein [Salinicola sp. RZ23]